tara:strand:+ start:4345 stop:6594 length:2250 start_codon:yes stop_codon:yes gene_type:complete
MLKLIYKVSIIVILNFLNIFSFSYAEIIQKIEIVGNERIPGETIKMFSNVSIGDDIKNSDLNIILMNIYDSDFFTDVKVSINKNNLIIKVVESPLVENVFIKGPKAKRIIESLRKVLIVKERKSYNEVLILEDKNRILDELKSTGYFFSKVNVSIEKLGDNKVNLNYDIEMGEKAKIRKISFIGDKIYKDRKLRGAILSEESKFWKFISGKKFLNQNLLNLDEKLLKKYFLNKGYYDVKINTSFAKIINENEFELIYNINAGQKYSFDKITLNLPIDFEKTNFSKLLNLFDDLKDETYSLYVIENILDEIDEIVLDEEYRSIESTVEEEIVDNKINLNFKIKEGKKYSVNKINIFGNNITLENVIRNQLLVDEGDDFNSILATKSINNIKSLNIFKSVNSQISENTDDRTKTINITVEEKATGEIMAGAGVGTDGATLSFAVKENNYLGRGIGLKSEITISEESLKGQFEVTNPNYKNSDKSVYTNIQALETDRLSTSGYKTNKTGFGFGTKFEFQDDLYIGIGQDSYYEKIDTNSTASVRQKAQEGDYWDTFINLDFDYDKRNQKYKTSDGFRSSYNVKLPIISENNSLTNSYTYTYFNELYEENISKVSFFVRTANSLTNDDVKLSERIFLPARKLRGFQSGKVGPKDGNDFIGGNYAATMNLSSTLPQVLPNSQNLDVLMFMDVANIWGVDYDSSLNDTNEIRSSVGIGIDWFTVIGPLSISLAHPVTKVDSDKTETFKFNLGTTF